MNASELDEVINGVAQSAIGQNFSPSEKIAAYYSAPVLYAYSNWVIEQARKLRFKRLYFLARDGYLLQKICEMISVARDYGIECRYLYASRLAWRVPSFHLIGEEAYDLIFMRAYRITFRSILQRFQANERDYAIYAQLAGILPEQLDDPMSVRELETLEQRLRPNPIFRALVEKKSREAYKTTIDYLRQEKILDGNPIAVVDTGWTGSIQRSLRCLVRSAGCSGQISGFYFGLYQEPKDLEDGVYYSWYFSKESSFNDIVQFNNNVLESMCMAPHPMTCGYQYNGDQVIPVWKKTDRQSKTLFQIEKEFAIIMKVSRRLLDQISIFESNMLLENIRKRMKQLCFHPTDEEAMGFADCMFCDDSSESYLSPLVQKITQKKASSYFILRRLFNRKRIHVKNRADLFWPYGCFAVSDIRWKNWYRLNVYLWDIIWNYRK